MENKKVFMIFRIDDPENNVKEIFLGIVKSFEEAKDIISIITDREIDLYNNDVTISEFDSGHGAYSYNIDIDYGLYEESYAILEEKIF